MLLFLRRNHGSKVGCGCGFRCRPGLTASGLRDQNNRHVVMLRGRRRLFLLHNSTCASAFPVAIGMPGWETSTGRFEVLQKIPNPGGASVRRAGGGAGSRQSLAATDRLSSRLPRP